MGGTTSASLQSYGLGVVEGKLQGTITWDGVEYIVMGVPKDIKGLQKEPRLPATEKSQS